jgi:hypothetical protein
MFEGPKESPITSLEFIGSSEITLLQLNDPPIPNAFPDGSWKVKDFDYKASRIHLVYTNPGNPRLPRSFVLHGLKNYTHLTMMGITYTGEFSCGLL